MSDERLSWRRARRLVATLALGLLAATGTARAQVADEDRVEALAEEVARLEAQLRSLEDQVEQDRLAEIERRLEVLTEELESMRLGEVVAEADAIEYGYGPAASKIYRTEQGLSIGGYGEMLYENFDGDKKDELDFLRAIVYFGYKFNDRFLFNSEIEFEHASTGKSGEASVEFAYLDYLHDPAFNVRAGLLLAPMGFVNELHEPTVFLGAKRPVTETVIIPSTWRENGVGVFGELGPVSYRSYVLNGLKGESFTASGLRGGRQKGSSALAEDFAWVTRVDYTPLPGLLLGGSVYLGGSGQGVQGPDGETLEVGTTIFEGHAEWSWQGLELRALGAWAELDDVAALNSTLGLTGSRSIGEELQGYYLQAGYDVLSRLGSGERQLTPYVRWEHVNTQEAVPAGFSADPANDLEVLTLGLDFKPIDQIVLKVDFQDHSNEAGTATDQFNVGIGYIF